MTRRTRRLLRLSLIVLIGAPLAGGGLGLWAGHVIKKAARNALFHPPDAVPPKPVAIVFGAKVTGDTLSNILEDRVRAAIRLYEQGTVNKILLSGDHGRHEYDEVNAMRNYALRHGVPAEDLFLDHAGFRTYDTLYRARDVFGVRSAVLVTNAFHLPRALYTGKRLGLDVVGLASDTRTYRSWFRNDCREFLARTLAWVQVNVTCPRPRFLGPRIDLNGDGRTTHDRP